ncbi:MAG: pitrilysin family protein [Phycisphaerae bacterium]
MQTDSQRGANCLLVLAALLTTLSAAGDARAADIAFTRETLANGLRVIYAPLHQAPVVHVRVLYHVGSRDEQPDRQGFAHMFEHMMFRGSEHVEPEEHMKLIGTVGGYSNAYTSFDETVYINTVPASQLELALYLEADRMASFRVSDDIYRTERNVVTEEWRMMLNRPYGTLWQDLCALLFTRHPYRWTPIGNMNHLRRAEAAELQDFFNRYYVPRNAVLVIAGDIDVDRTGALARRCVGWIPGGEEAQRGIPPVAEPEGPRRREVRYRVPLAKVLLAWPAAPHASDDVYGLDLLATILGGGRSSRLQRDLVYGPKPRCVDAGASNWTLEDAGVFLLSATVLGGRDPAEVETALAEAVAAVRSGGVSPEELAKAKTLARVGLIRGRETASDIAGELGQEALIAGDPARANRRLQRIEAVTRDDVRALAAKYLAPDRVRVLCVTPDPAGAREPGDLIEPVESKRPLEPREVAFPEGHPDEPPVAEATPNPEFAKGAEIEVHGVRVIVMPDKRLPLVNWNLTMRRGAHAEPPEKLGLADLTAGLVRRGAGDLTFADLNADLEARGIRIEVAAGGDTTRLAGSATTGQLEHALRLSRLILREPALPVDEFDRLKEQRLNQLRLARENPGVVAGHELDEALFGSTPLGRHATPETVAAVTLDDVKAFYRATYRPTDAVFVISGDVTVERGRALAERLLADWPAAPLPEVDYTLPRAPEERTIVLVDRPEGKQSTVRLGVRAYTVHNDDKFAGALANRILSYGIDSRLGKYVRAEKGLAYRVRGTFRPERHAGAFIASVDTKAASTAEAVEAMFEVFTRMRRQDVTDEEIAEAKLATAGSMVMGMQTIAQQAARRVEGILNGYPIDYYDRYPDRVARVTKDAVREVMQTYVSPDEMAIVVVAPAEAVREQLERLGKVTVVPMPARRGQGSNSSRRSGQS